LETSLGMGNSAPKKKTKCARPTAVGFSSMI
jgi:hypothetical protein